MRRLLTLAAASLISFTACDNSDDPTPNPTVPENYTFENVNYSGQTVRMQLLDSLVKKIRSANDGTKVMASDLYAIYDNTPGLFNTDKNLSSKTYDADRSTYYAYFDQVEDLSGSTENLVGGNRLMTPEGVELVQAVAKGLMGAVLYYQATSHYLTEAKMNVDNSEVTEGEGTAMQHHWDEAFGYFGAPENYLTLSDEQAEESSKFWAKYALEMAPVVDVRDAMFTAFIEGRAAINRNDLEARDAAIETIRTNWDKLVAACAVHYINNSLADLENNDMAALYHHWSEGYGFATSLKYNVAKAISNDQYTQLMNLFGQNPQATSVEDLRAANVLLQEVYGFSNAEMQNL